MEKRIAGEKVKVGGECHGIGFSIIPQALPLIDGLRPPLRTDPRPLSDEMQLDELGVAGIGIPMSIPVQDLKQPL